MLVEMWALERIKPYPGNPRKRSKVAVEKVAASIREFGVRQPIVVDEAGIILVGHTRRDAAELLAMAEFPVHQALGLTEAQKRAYRIADNRTNEETEWDLPLLKLELGELKGLDLDLKLTGLDSRELDELLRTDDERADDAPPLPECAVTRPGDLWLMGEHRLLCGDATKAEDVARACGGAKPFLMVTDPPYGVNYSAKWRDDAARAGLIGWPAKAILPVQHDDQADWSAAFRLFTGSVGYLWHASAFAVVTASAVAQADLDIRSQIIWAKQRFAISRQATLEGSGATFEHVKDGRRLEAEDAIKEEVLGGRA